ncbi:hypothetical protein CsSME_00028327 [Camellia sinensis var. sinensis]
MFYVRVCAAKTEYTIDLLHTDMVRGGPGSYSLQMNQSEIRAEIHTRDGGLLSWPKFCNKCKELKWMHLLTLHVSNINTILL